MSATAIAGNLGKIDKQRAAIAKGPNHFEFGFKQLPEGLKQ